MVTSPSSNSVQLYGLRSSGKAHGDVFTRSEVVRAMLDIAGYQESKNLSHIRILEPSCGIGDFLVEILRRLKVSATMFNFDFGKAVCDNIVACEIDAEKIEKCKQCLHEHGFQTNLVKFIAGDYLNSSVGNFDVVVGNPPYVRYENIPAKSRAEYKKMFKSFHYRPDLYVMFFEKSLMALNAGGRCVLISPNRWLKNEYGRKLRKLVAGHFHVEKIIDMEKVDAFQEEVLAYPCITSIVRAGSQTTTYFKIERLESLQNLNECSNRREVKLEGDEWANMYSQRSGDKLSGIESMGFHIGIGVATGADKVFVSKDLPNLVEKELLIPAISARDLRNNSFKWHGQYLLNPFCSNGDLIDLELYPRAAFYLDGYGQKLKARHVAQKNPRLWYRTIDRIQASLRFKPKILLPDMSGNSMVFVDNGEFYPQHNIYYISGQEIDSLKALAALLMSDIARSQLASLSNCMNGGYPRWQSQYLRQLRLPSVLIIDEEIRKSLVKAYEAADLTTINRIANKSIV